MILAFRYTPGPSPEHTTDQDPGTWICVGTFTDEKALAVADDAEYAIYTPTKATVSGPEVMEELPSSFKFDRRVTVKTPTATPRVATAK